MMKRRVFEEAASWLIAYFVGLGAILLLPDAMRADNRSVLVVGLPVLLVTSLIVDWIAFKRRPRLAFSGLHWPAKADRRPLRYSAPWILVFIAYSTAIQILKDTQSLGQGLTMYVLLLPVLLAYFASDWLWARAIDKGVSDTGEGPRPGGWVGSES
jgi:hypothetical protein